MPTPSKFTKAVRENVLEALRLGASQRTAAAYAGIGHQTLIRWLKEGRAATSGAKFEFAREVDACEAAPRLRALRVIHDEMPNKPELAKWFLERREREFAPPQPATPATAAGPVVINLALADGALPALMGPALDVIEGEVVDEQDVEPAGA